MSLLFVTVDIAFDLVSSALSALSRALGWLRGTPSSAPATATSVAAVEARFNAIDARLAALSRDAHAAAHAVVAQKATYALPIGTKPSAVCAQPKRASLAAAATTATAGALRDGAGVTILAPTCDVPYATARQEMATIGQRLMVIGGSTAPADMKEAFIAEKRLAEWERILPQLDGFVDEHQLSQDKWRAANNNANAEALRRVRSCLPTNVTCLSEDQLIDLETPSGHAFPVTLAQRLKDMPILGLLREKKIEPMHPSVLRRLSSHGLSLLERRALFVALQAPASAWHSKLQEQQSAESNWSQLSLLEAKMDWYQQLADELMRVAGPEPVEASFGLYAKPLGFPIEA